MDESLKLPDDMSPEHGAVMSRAMYVTLSDVLGRSRQKCGSDYGGPIGNLVAQTAKAMGAAKVIITEIMSTV